MNLQVPSVGTQPGPDYALNVNTSLELIDAHNHSPGYGVQITPDGLDLNSDISIQDNNLLDVRSVRFTSQPAPIGDPADLGCIYVADEDLYYNDTNGNQIRLTQGGSIVGSSGSITGLVPPATASYDAFSETFIWQSDVNEAASMDSGPVTIRKAGVASSPGITLTAPGSLASDYSLTLPAAPPSAVFALVMDASGNVTTNEITPISAMTVTNNLTLTTGNLILTNGDITITDGDLSMPGASSTITAKTIVANVSMYPSGASNAVLTSSDSLTTLNSSRPIITGATFTSPILITGNVNSAGTILSGGGFSVSHPGTGQYTITYNGSIFDGVTIPVPVACCNTTGGTIATVTGLATGSFQVRTTDSGGSPGDRAFTFIVFGTRV